MGKGYKKSSKIEPGRGGYEEGRGRGKRKKEEIDGSNTSTSSSGLRGWVMDNNRLTSVGVGDGL
jgi:hypothetical protein